MDEDLSGYADSKYFVPDLGIFHLTVSEAAELIAIDMWISGDVKAEPEPEDQDIEPNDPRLKVALADTIKVFISRLLKAIQNGDLKAEIIRRDFEERLLPAYTYIEKSALIGWLSERGYTTDVAFEEWEDIQQEIYSAAFEEVVALKAVGKAGHRAIRHFIFQKHILKKEGTLDLTDPRSVLAALQECLVENTKLKQRIAEGQTEHVERVSRPLLTRERDTLLNIIGALVELIQTHKPGRNSDAAVIHELIDNYSDKPGIKQRTLQEKFAAAKRSLLSN